MKPRLWLFLVGLAVLWYLYETNRDMISVSWDRFFGSAQRGMYFVIGGVVFYMFFFQRNLLSDIFRSVAAIDNDPRLNKVNAPVIGLGARGEGGGGDYRYPGVRTKHKRNVSALLKKKIAANQQWRCAGCSRMLDETYEVDHVVALDYGGTNDPSNLRALCPHCHRKKTVDERIQGW